MIVPQQAEPLKALDPPSDPLDDTVGEYRTYVHRQRTAALEELSQALRIRGWQAVPTQVAHVWDLPWMRIYALVAPGDVRHAHVEIRHGLGNVDWICWREGKPIVPADSPVRASELIIRGLGG